jgi:hypothetical protein
MRWLRIFPLRNSNALTKRLPGKPTLGVVRGIAQASSGVRRMHRMFGLLALAAAAYGVWVLFSGPEPDTFSRAARTASDSPMGYSNWALGLVTGLALAWLATVDWRGFPARAGAWLRLQRRRLGLIVIGGLCAGVLLLF